MFTFRNKPDRATRVRQGLADLERAVLECNQARDLISETLDTLAQYENKGRFLEMLKLILEMVRVRRAHAICQIQILTEYSEYLQTYKKPIDRFEKVIDTMATTDEAFINSLKMLANEGIK